MKSEAPSPAAKAHQTAKWARTLTKVEIARRRGGRVRWNVVDFGGRSKAEARGIVDLMAIRKDHTTDNSLFRRGDLFEIILIQTKGGSASDPSAEDRRRLRDVATRYAAKVVLATWQRGRTVRFFELTGDAWAARSAAELFGRPSVGREPQG